MEKLLDKTALVNATHIYRERKPRRGICRAMSYLCQVEGDSNYYITRSYVEHNLKYTPEEVDERVKSGEFIPFEKQCLLQQNQTLYIDFKGHIYRAIEGPALRDRNKTFIACLDYLEARRKNMFKKKKGKNLELKAQNTEREGEF